MYGKTLPCTIQGSVLSDMGLSMRGGVGYSGVNHFGLDDFLGAVGDAVHGPHPLQLRPPLHVLGHALGLQHLPDDTPIAVLRLFVQVGETGKDASGQKKVIEQEGIGVLQIHLVHTPPLPNGTLLRRQETQPPKNVDFTRKI